MNSVGSVSFEKRRMFQADAEPVRTGVEPVGSFPYEDADW